MLLRLFLVSVATSMGLELPSSRDVSCWTESGEAWVNAQLCDRTAPGVQVVPATESVAARPLAEADQAFEVVSGELAAAFAADPVVTSEELPTVATAGDAAPAGVIELAAVGLPDGEELATVVGVDSAVEPGSIATIDQPAVEVEDEAPSRADQLALAIRLSREAAQAWAAVIQESVGEVGSGR